MHNSARQTWRIVWVATRSMVFLTLVLGVGYTALMTGILQLTLPAQANGSMVTTTDGRVVGSSLIGQNFTDEQGNPLPEYFQSRPSAAGDNGYDGGGSSGTNYGPENPDLIASVTERKQQIAEFNGVSPDAVPADAVTASSSGLDPHISPEYAEIQVARVAKARGIDEATVRTLVTEHTSGRDLGYVGEPVVNVLELNVALDELKG